MTTSATEAGIKKRISDKRQEQSKKTDGFRNKLAGAIKRACSTADGKILLHYLMTECGYQMNSVQGSSSSGELLENNTLYNEARRDLSLSLRKFQRLDVLVDVEIYGVLQHLKVDDNFDDLF